MRGRYTLGEKVYIVVQISIMSMVAIAVISIVAMRMIQ